MASEHKIEFVKGVIVQITRGKNQLVGIGNAYHAGHGPNPLVWLSREQAEHLLEVLPALLSTADKQQAA